MRMARLKRFLPSLLMLAGVVLLIYVAAQYGSMYAAQRRLAQEWQQQNVPLPARPAGLVTTLTRLTVPSIRLDAVVVEGVDRKDLLMGPGHLTETPEPGQPGNSVISGHRDTFFRHVHELKPGDSIFVERAGRQYQYQVTGKKVVQPTDMAVVQPTPDAELTLLTCYPTYYIGPAPQRLVVFSKLVGVKGGGERPAQAKPVAAGVP